MAGLAVGDNAVFDPFDNGFFAHVNCPTTLSDFGTKLIENHAALFGDVFPSVTRQQ